MIPRKDIGKAYQLTLRGVGSWNLSSSRQMLPWLSQFAGILELKKHIEGICAQEIFFDEAGQGVHFLFNQKIAFESRLRRIFVPQQGRGPICFEMNAPNGDNHIKFLHMWHALQPIYQQAIDRGGLPFHAALVEVMGQGIILAGHGNAGKSTAARRLDGRWKPLCDDEALAVFDKETGYRAHPFPTWSDYILRSSRKTWNVQYSVPLRALLFLEKATRDEIIPLHPSHAALLINESAVQVCKKLWIGAKKDDRRRFAIQTFNNACAMAKRIPAYTLRVSLTGRFWEKIEKAVFRNL